MLVIAGAIQIEPDKHDEAVEAALEMMRETHKEEGCITYVFTADLAQRGHFRIFEEWESQSALDAHFEAPHMAAFGAKMGQLGVQGMSVQKYQIESVGPVR